MQQTPSPCTAGETLAPEQIVEKTISRNGENRKCRGRSGSGVGATRVLRRSWKWTTLLEKLDDEDSNFGDLPKKVFGRRKFQRRKVGKEKPADFRDGATLQKPAENLGRCSGRCG